MRTVIRVSCIDQQLKAVASPLLASGGMNEAVVAFDFCEKWDGFAKTGVFYRDEEDVYYSLLDDNDECIIPHEVYDEPGTFYFTVFGDKDDIRRTASTLRYKAYKGVVGDAMKPSDPTPDVYDQIMAKLNGYDGGSGGGASVQADWSQNDETQPDYVKNRTHYEEVTQESIEGVELSWNIGQDHDTIPFELGQTWDFYLYNNRSGNWINWNYTGANDEGHYPVQQATDGTFYIGDPNVNDIPFYITTTSSALNGSFENMNNATKLKIVGASGTKTVTKVKTLDEKFMPLDMVVELDVSGDEPVGKIISGTFEACKQKIENDIPARVKVIEKGVGYKAVMCFEFVLMTQDSNEVLCAYGFDAYFGVLADGTVTFV